MGKTGQHKDLADMRFGRWLVTSTCEARQRKNSNRNDYYWLCKCDCGTERFVEASRLISGGSKSCGCMPPKNMTQRAIESRKARELNYIGKKYGRLTVVEGEKYTVSPNGKRIKKRKCLCDCGATTYVATNLLTTGKTKSCGCLKREKNQELRKTHGMSETPLYAVWRSIKERCNPQIGTVNKDYIGRGITMCEEWRLNFMSFYTWSIHNGYEEGLQIDRIDNDGNYEPSNCRWVDRKRQVRNRRVTIRLIYKGKETTLADLCEEHNIPYQRGYQRLRRGYTPEEIVELKVGEFLEKRRKESVH